MSEFDGDDNTAVYEAFEAAIEYFHGQLDATITDHVGGCTHDSCLVIDEDECTRPPTAREYFEEHREWSAETIAERKLGWAPGGGGLAAALRSQGFSDEEMRATGLFTKDLRQLWRGRYVLPYFDAEGRPVYAIARVTGGDGGGKKGYDGHPEDYFGGKYAKMCHTRDHVPLSEPIFGQETLGQSEEIVIAEGIADAITVAAAGYSVLSPVTVQFKKKHFDELLQLVGEGQQVYVVPDNERAGFSRIDSEDIPEEPEHIYEALNLPKVSAGMGGALRTANYLCEHDVDARVVELPRSGLRKVDLDDYLHGWADDIGTVLRSAQPPGQHPDFTAATEGQITEIDGDTNGFDDNPGVPEDRPDTDSDLGASRRDGRSALWDLSLAEVNENLGEGSRSKNPLGHIGDSENYFHVFRPEDDADLLAVDYKRKKKYNALTYLLVEEEARDVTAPGGSLSAEETWIAWSAARERGLLGPTDTIPVAALRYIAEDRSLYDFDALADDDDDAPLPAKAHNAALWWVQQRWWPTVRDDDDETDATARSKQSADRVSPRTWEDVRYRYEEIDAAKYGRHAARQLLQAKYDFMVISETEELTVYDPETGVFTDELSEINGEINDGLGVHWSSHERSEIIEGIKQHNVVERRHLNGRGLDTPHICVGNGVLDLIERDLKPHSPDYCFVDRIAVEYDEAASTAAYEEFLDDLTYREEDALAMMEMVGHALVPDANERYKKFLMLYGDSDNGKSEFYNRVEDLLCRPAGGDDKNNISNVKLEKLASNRFSANSVHGHMANIAGEIEGKKIRNTATIKDITGGDSMEIEPKGTDSYFDKINATLMFAANDPPIIGVRDKSAIANRIVPVELPFTFVDEPSGEWEKEKIPSRELDDKLSTDEAMSGLLSLALDGIERLEANNGDVSLPESDQQRLEHYESAADPMAEFARECLTSHTNDYVVKDDITAVFMEYAEANGFETGEGVHDTLHSIVRGTPSLAPGEGRPRTPDYSDTTLSLRPWDERKKVLKRITLSETGLEHARSAGLVVDSETDAEDDAPSLTPIEDLAPGDGYVDVRATVSGILDPPEWIAGEGSMEDETSEIDYKVPAAKGDTELAIALNEGTQYRIENAKVTTDEGALVLELREGRTNLVRLGENERDDDQQSMTAVADGGAQTVDVTDERNESSDSAEAESDTATDNDETDSSESETTDAADDEPDLGGLLPRGLMYVRANHGDSSKGVPQYELVDHLKEHGATESQSEHVIEKLLSRGEIHEPSFNHYRA